MGLLSPWSSRFVHFFNYLLMILLLLVLLNSVPFFLSRNSGNTFARSLEDFKVSVDFCLDFDGSYIKYRERI